VVYLLIMHYFTHSFGIGAATTAAAAAAAGVPSWLIKVPLELKLL